MSMFLFEDLFLNLLGLYLGMELPSHVVILYLPTSTFAGVQILSFSATSLRLTLNWWCPPHSFHAGDTLPLITESFLADLQVCNSAFWMRRGPQKFLNLLCTTCRDAKPAGHPAAHPSSPSFYAIVTPEPCWMCWENKTSTWIFSCSPSISEDSNKFFFFSYYAAIRPTYKYTHT